MKSIGDGEALKQQWLKEGLRITGSNAFPASNPLRIDLENLELLLWQAKYTPEGLFEELFSLGE